MTIIRVSLIDATEIIPYASAPVEAWKLVSAYMLSNMMHQLGEGELRAKIKAVLQLGSNTKVAPEHASLEAPEVLVFYSMVCSALAKISCESAFESYEAAFNPNGEWREPEPIDTPLFQMMRAFLDLCGTLHDVVQSYQAANFAEVRRPTLSLVS